MTGSVYPPTVTDAGTIFYFDNSYNEGGVEFAFYAAIDESDCRYLIDTNRGFRFMTDKEIKKMKAISLKQFKEQQCDEYSSLFCETGSLIV